MQKYFKYINFLQFNKIFIKLLVKNFSIKDLVLAIDGLISSFILKPEENTNK